MGLSWRSEATRRFIFGSRQQQIVGHGRAPDDVPSVTDRTIVEHAAYAKSVGLEFLYLFNGRCDHLDLKLPIVKQRVLEDLEWVVQEVKAPCVIVADPRVAQLL